MNACGLFTDTGFSGDEGLGKVKPSTVISLLCFFEGNYCVPSGMLYAMKEITVKNNGAVRLYGPLSFLEIFSAIEQKKKNTTNCYIQLNWNLGKN